MDRRPAAVICLMLAGFSASAHAAGRQATVRERARIHSGAGAGYFVIQDAAKGEVYDVVEARKGWVKVRLADGAFGWLPRGAVVVGRADRASRGREVAPPDVPDDAGADLAGGGEAPLDAADDAAAADPEAGWSDGFNTLEAEAPPDLPVGFLVRVGVGSSSLSHGLKTDAGESYSYGVRAFALDIDGTWWISPAFGWRGRVLLDWAPKRLKADRQEFEIDPPDAAPAADLSLSASGFGVDGAAVLRTQVIRVGAWVEGRLGLRWWSFDVDRVPSEAAGRDDPVDHPAFNPLSFVGPVVGGGFQLPFSPWIGVRGAVDFTPLAWVGDPLGDGPMDTRSGDVDGAAGAIAEGGFWLTPYDSADLDIDIDFKVRWRRMFTTFTAPDGEPAPRAADHRFLDPYRKADSQEGAFGVLVSVVARR